MQTTIDLYQAIDLMRAATKEGKPFSMVFMAYSQKDQKSNGPVKVNKALLRKGTRVEGNRYADIMLNYYDLDSHQNRQFYQPLLMYFDKYKVALN